MGEWDGVSFTPDISSLKYSTTYAPAAIVFVVTRDFGEFNVTFTVNWKTCKRKKDVLGVEEYEEHEVYDLTLKRPLYESDATETVTLTIPAYERAGTAYRVGTSSLVYEITSITTNVSDATGKGNFYALASVGSKLIYGLSYEQLNRDLDAAARSIWGSPPPCLQCGGTGVISNGDEICSRCDGYGYDGISGVDYLLKNKGKEVGVSRETSELLPRFQDRIWMKKWWVTPTKDSIKRVFAHFANLASQEEVIILERYSDKEPVWQVMLPTGFGAGSHFDYEEESDRNVFKDLLDSVTPVGTVSWLTWYSNKTSSTSWENWGDDVLGSGTSLGGLLFGESSLSHGFGGEWGDIGFPSGGWSTELRRYASGDYAFLSGMLNSGEVGYEPDGYAGWYYPPHSGFEYPYGT